LDTIATGNACDCNGSTKAGGVTPMSLEGRRIVVTGGASGIGAGTVRALAADGAAVAILDVDDDRGRALATNVDKDGGTAEFHHCNVSSRSAVFAAFDAASRSMGGIDALFAIAGTQVALQLAEEVDDADWDLVQGVNMKGVLFSNQAACLHMRSRSYGKIVNCASYAAANGLPGAAAYAASKGAVISWSRTVAREWSRYGIRVNVVNPVAESGLRHRSGGLTRFEPEGPVPRSWQFGDEWYEQRVLFRGSTGVKGDAERDIGPVMRFLASAESDYMAGQVINVDGGLDMTR
jgi:2-hydroxycyclohexanecarboxyl-CoA dehydrogenase